MSARYGVQTWWTHNIAGWSTGLTTGNMHNNSGVYTASLACVWRGRATSDQGAHVQTWWTHNIAQTRVTSDQGAHGQTWWTHNIAQTRVTSDQGPVQANTCVSTMSARYGVQGRGQCKPYPRSFYNIPSATCPRPLMDKTDGQDW